MSGYSRNGSGVYGQSTDGFGLFGVSTNEVSVYGRGTNTAGLFASTPSTGVHGETGSDDPMVAAVDGLNLGGGKGVAGYGIDDAGVYGESTHGFGVVGFSVNEVTI